MQENLFLTENSLSLGDFGMMTLDFRTSLHITLPISFSNSGQFKDVNIR